MAALTRSEALYLDAREERVRGEGYLEHVNAHFLLEKEEGDSHVYVADGAPIELHAVGSAGLLRDAHRVWEDLRLFCVHHGLTTRGSLILPLPENRDQFIVRARDYGLE